MTQKVVNGQLLYWGIVFAALAAAFGWWLLILVTAVLVGIFSARVS